MHTEWQRMKTLIRQLIQEHFILKQICKLSFNKTHQHEDAFRGSNSVCCFLFFGLPSHSEYSTLKGRNLLLSFRDRYYFLIEVLGLSSMPLENRKVVCLS